MHDDKFEDKGLAVKAVPRFQIIRGLPGSGKTTLAVSRYPHLLRLETDMYFYRGGEYRYTGGLNKKAVAWFGGCVERFCGCGFDFVATGVFTAHTERLDTAISSALGHGYEVWVKTLESDYGNVHGVSEADLESMRERFVPDSRLREMYSGESRVKFGLMADRQGVSAG